MTKYWIEGKLTRHLVNWYGGVYKPEDTVEGMEVGHNIAVNLIRPRCGSCLLCPSAFSISPTGAILDENKQPIRATDCPMDIEAPIKF